MRAEVVPGMIACLDDVPAPGPPPNGIDVEEVHLDDLDPFIDLISWRYDLATEVAPATRRGSGC